MRPDSRKYDLTDDIKAMLRTPRQHQSPARLSKLRHVRHQGYFRNAFREVAVQFKTQSGSCIPGPVTHMALELSWCVG